MRKFLLKVKINFIRDTKNYRIYSVERIPGLAVNLLPDTVYLNKDLFDESKNQEELTLSIF